MHNKIHPFGSSISLGPIMIEMSQYQTCMCPSFVRSPPKKPPNKSVTEGHSETEAVLYLIESLETSVCLSASDMCNIAVVLGWCDHTDITGVVPILITTSLRQAVIHSIGYRLRPTGQTVNSHVTIITLLLLLLLRCTACFGIMLRHSI